MNLKNIPLETKIGTVLVTVTSSNHVHVGTAAGHPITVNTVQLHLGGLHLSDYGEGFELTHNQRTGQPCQQYLSASKVNEPDYNKAQASDAARRKILEVVGQAVNEWAKQNPLTLKYAALEQTKTALIRKGEEIGVLDLQLKAAEVERERLRRHETELLNQIGILERKSGK